MLYLDQVELRSFDMTTTATQRERENEKKITLQRGMTIDT